jgi:Domain of unknown function (DUF4383)
MSAKTLALVFGVVFILVGLLGYIDNPIIGDSGNAVFHADSTHNMVHIVSGALFVLVALMAPGAARGFMILFGLVYLAIGILGLTSIGSEGMTQVLGFLHVNGADNYLHIALGVVILLAGLASRRQVVTVQR